MHIKFHYTIISVAIFSLGFCGLSFSSPGQNSMLAYSNVIAANNTVATDTEINSKHGSHNEMSDEIDTFTWHFESGSWWSLDKKPVSIKADADIKVINQKVYSETAKSIESARQRLDGIIPPAIREVIGSSKKNELFMKVNQQDGWTMIKSKLNERILSLISHKPTQFGMEITNLQISAK